MVANQASFLRERTFLAVSINHFFIDVLNSSRNLLVAILAVQIGLTNAQVGIALLLYNVGSSLSQPLFGWLADRVGPRWLVVGGIGWMICFFTITAVANEWVALVAITLAGLGSGSFHPTGTMVASTTSLEFRNRATAVFFMSGQLGLFIGPILAGILLQQLGRPGFIVLPALSLVAFVSAWQWLSGQAPDLSTSEPAERSDASDTGLPAATGRQGLLLGFIIISYSTVGIAAMSFAPKLFTELGYEPGYVGLLSGLFMMGSAAGGIFGGALADRIQGKWVIIGGLLASVLPIYFYLPVEGFGRFSLLFLAGFFNTMPHTILVLMVQALLPGRRALASGLALGFMFFSGSVGSYALGLVADRVGLALALQATAVLPIIAGAAALLLPEQRAARTAAPGD